jgi:hypothetical protein
MPRRVVGMDHLYSPYDALVSIHVPTDRARAVVDAMERDMYDRLATKADLIHMREMLSKDIQLQIASLSNQMTVRFGGMTAAGIGVLFTLLKLT